MKSKYGYYRVASAAFPIHVAHVAENVKEIEKLIAKAKEEDCQVLVFPELCLTGYTAQDLLLRKPLLDASEEALLFLAKEVPPDMLVFLGLPLAQGNKVFNVAAALSGGKVVGLVPKTYLPSSEEYYEKRWFSSSKELQEDFHLLSGEKVPFGVDLLFSFGELVVGAEICEDLWAIKKASDDLVLSGANLIVNLSASDELLGKRDYRRKLVGMQSSRTLSCYLYCSSGEGESSQDLVFSGHCLLFEEGKLVFESLDEMGVRSGLVDIQRVMNRRRQNKSAFDCESSIPVRTILLPSEKEISFLPESVDPHPFLEQDPVLRKERSREVLSLQSKGLANRLRNIHVGKVILGVSGGLDSTLALLVCVEAFSSLSLPRKDIHCFSMPSKATTTQTFDNAKALVELLGASYHEIPIESTLAEHLRSLNHPEDVYDTTYENAQARIRTLILMDEANALGGIVVGTGDLSEACLGFSTYNGDHMSMYGVNVSVPKTLVQAVVEDYGKDHEKVQAVLSSIVKTPISPELVPGKDSSIAQKTEKIIGRYELHDFFLYHFLHDGFDKEKIRQLSHIAFSSLPVGEIDRTLAIFFDRFFTQQFKRSCLPDGVKVTEVSISPRGDLRMPSDLDKKNTFNP